MKIKEFKKQNIQEIGTDDLRIVLSMSFNKKIVSDVQKELIRRDSLK